MNLPLSPPTDNLYKFAATTGVLVLIAVFVFTVVQIDRIETESDALRADEAVIAAEIKNLRSDFEITEEKDKPAFHARLVEIEGKTALIDAKRESLKRRDERVWKLSFVAILFSVIAFSIAAWGFRRWYQRLQKPQDHLLRAEVLAGLQRHGGRLEPPPESSTK